MVGLPLHVRELRYYIFSIGVHVHGTKVLPDAAEWLDIVDSITDLRSLEMRYYFSSSKNTLKRSIDPELDIDFTYEGHG